MKKLLLLRKFSFLGGGLVFLSCLPRVFNAWIHSRLDSWDWIFYLLFAVLLSGFMWRGERPKLSVERPGGALILLALCGGIFALGLLFQTNALVIVGGILIFWSSFYLSTNWKYAYRILPLFVILSLGTPSSSYWISTLLSLPSHLGLALKFFLAGLGLVWFYCNIRYHHHLRRGALFFGFSWLFLALLVIQAQRFNIVDQSFVPHFKELVGSSFGRELPVDQPTRNFFASSKVRQYHYILPPDQEITVLEVRCGTNRHEIHPASLCLRTRRWEVESERFIKVRENFHVNEIAARHSYARLLIWVWYSNEKISTASFWGFRRHFQSEDQWRVYQISTPIRESVKASRLNLARFLTELKESNDHE